MLIRTDGALLRYLEVLPRNPLVMDEAEAERMGHGFASLLARLPAGQALQAHVQATPVALDQLVDDYRAQVALALAPTEGRAPARTAALRELAEVYVESLHVHAAEHAAVRVRYLLVVPVNEQTGTTWAGALARSRRHGRVGTGADVARPRRRAALRARGARHGRAMLDGPEVADVLFARFAPAIAVAQSTLAPSRRPTILYAAHTSQDHEASAAFVRLHELVTRGQRIGLAGCTGHCLGPHPHFEVHLAGTWSGHERDVDPFEVLPRR